MEQNDDIRLELPNEYHFAAFIEAAKEVHNYTNNPENDQIKSREMKGFIFFTEYQNSITPEDFNKSIVKRFADRRLDDEHRPENPHRPSEKVPPSFAYFIMKEDKIIGFTTANPQKRTQDDIDNGVKSYSKWNHLTDTGVRVESSTIILPSQQSKGYASKAKHQLFKELRKEGVEQIVATVNTDNIASNAAQKSLCRKYGGNSFTTDTGKGRPPGIEYKEHLMNRYIIDITSLDNELNKENSTQLVAKHRGLTIPEEKSIQKTTLSLTNTNLGSEKE